MDFRNLCQKIDVDSIRAKIPPLPAMPAISMPQIKLPKSMPKLKSRKIFRSSRENVNAAGSLKHAAAQNLAPPIPPSDFINHTPKRISTISSLMSQTADAGYQSTYRRGCSVDDDYPIPTQYGGRFTRPISPIRAASLNAVDSPNHAAASSNARMSLTEKLQKSYKDLSEFRLKHIFAKKTVVRKDTIQVAHYVQRYDEDRQREELEQEKSDREIADNYRFKFKISRQNTGHTNSLSSNESAGNAPKAGAAQVEKVSRSVSHESVDESDMEASPPQRKTGIAAARFSKVRKPPMSASEEQNTEDTEDLEELAKAPPIPSALWSTKINRTPVETSPTARTVQQKVTTMSGKGYRDRLRRLTSYVSSHEESGAESEVASGGSKTKSHLRNFVKQKGEEGDTSDIGGRRKRKAPLTPQQSVDTDEHRSTTTAENTLTSIKQNFKRFQKSIKRQQPPPVDSEEEDVERDAQAHKPPSKTEKIASRLRRFRSRDNMENVSPKKEEGPKSPIQSITNKLQTWKKSFKKKPSDADAQTGDETSPEKQKRPSTLIKKLKHIRSRKNPNSTEDLDADDNEETNADKKKPDASSRKTLNLEEKFVQARQRTLNKVNEKMQNIRLFHRPQEQVGTENTKKSDSSDNEDDYEEANVPPAISRRGMQDAFELDFDRDDIEEVVNIQQEYAAHAVWTTKPILCDSMESDTDGECPRVLIHQDNSDIFESTLIIAVTRPASASASASPTPRISEMPTSPKIREISPTMYTPTSSPKPVDWIPNKEIISSFLDMTPPTKRKMSADDVVPSVRCHARKLSVDSNSDSDSWIPEGTRNKAPNQSIDFSRGTSLAGLNRIDENEEPWKVHTMFREEKLYKAKSIDIFDKNAKKGGANAVFEDFDDELKNTPVVKISSTTAACPENDSSDDVDAADDDNSSRVTNILVKVVREEGTEIYAENHTIADIRQATQLDQSQKRQFGNSRESLIADLDENDTDDESDRPPSAAPSPPPNIAPPPPPLPLRKSSMRIETKPLQEVIAPPPLPATRPPSPPSNPPPKIPERSTSMSRISKPLVKTSSLRLAYNEQVKPADVGKVNKLISRFEPPSKISERPRIIPRRTQQYDSEDYSEDDDDDEDTDERYSDQEERYSEESGTCEQNVAHANAKFEHDTTPTPTNTPKLKYNGSRAATKMTTILVTTENSDEIHIPTSTNCRDVQNNIEHHSKFEQKSPVNIPKISLNLDRNSNCSRPSSEYGSPLEYPSSLIGSTETTPVPDRREQEMLNIRRSRRSMTRDDERFFSFDSDEENSYYSISSTGSSRYVVEI